MTGAYLRIERDGKWEAIEVERLTPDERRTALARREMEEVMRWMDLVCRVLADLEAIIIREPEPPAVPPAEPPPPAPQAPPASPR